MFIGLAKVWFQATSTWYNLAWVPAFIAVMTYGLAKEVIQSRKKI